MNESVVKARIALAMEYPVHQQGGVEVLVRELVRGLAKRFEIVLVTKDKNQAALGEEFDSLVASHLSWSNDDASPQSARELAAALVNEKIAFAHFHSGGTYEWQSRKASRSPIIHLTRAGVPCLVTNHFVQSLLEGFCDPKRPAWQKALLLPKAWISKAFILNRVQAEYTVSKHDEARMKRFFPLLNGNLRQMYHSRLARTSIGLPMDQREKTIFCLGTICRRKGQTVLARAFALVSKRHPTWKLHLMGLDHTSAYADQVRDIVLQSGISDRVLISPPQSDPSPFLQSSSIFAMPSLVEGLGLSLQEALYYECASVGSAAGGIPELIEHDSTGLLVPPGDVAALASALDRLIVDPDLRMRLTRRARASIVAKGMLSDIMVENHARLYEAILRRHVPKTDGFAQY